MGKSNDEAAIPRASTEASSGTVTVACKLPHGLELQLCDPGERSEPVMGGGMRTVKVWNRAGKSILVHGNAVAIGATPKVIVANGYAFTSGVPAAFWNDWLAQNKDHPAVVNKLIFAHGDEKSARSEAREHRDLRNGQEPIDPRPESKDPRMTRGIETKRDDDARDAA